MEGWPKAKFNDRGWQLELLVTISLFSNVLFRVGGVAIKFPDIFICVFKNVALSSINIAWEHYLNEVKYRSSGKILQKKAAEAVVTFGYDHRKQECFLLHVQEGQRENNFPHNKRLWTWPCRGRKSQCKKLASPESKLPRVVLSRFSRSCQINPPKQVPA